MSQSIVVRDNVVMTDYSGEGECGDESEYSGER